MITSVARLLQRRRIAQIKRFDNEAKAIQEEQLRKLVAIGYRTQYGKAHEMKPQCTYQEFADALPIAGYDVLQPWIERTLKGETDILWPGRTKYFAQSAGTTQAKQKVIPISNESLRTIHFRGGFDSVASYIAQNPQSRYFNNRSLVIGAGCPQPDAQGNQVAQLSGILMQHLPLIGQCVRLPSAAISRIENFTEKIQLATEETITKRISNFSGIPTTYLTFFHHALEITGKQNALEIWPDLELFIHGGISFAPYHEQFKTLIPSPQMHYMEVYNASEGFFALQSDLNDPSMLLMLDYGIFYEFIPLKEIDDPHPSVLPLWEVEVGNSYAIVITTNSGLWRYMIGDVVTFTSTNPYKIIISGRTKHFINICGEELMVGQADLALQRCCATHHAEVRDYTVTAQHPTPSGKIRHQWLIEFTTPPASLNAFATSLDHELCNVNFDYECKRSGDIFMEPLELTATEPGLLNKWLSNNNRLGGQSKIPRLSEQRTLYNELLELNDTLKAQRQP